MDSLKLTCIIISLGWFAHINTEGDETTRKPKYEYALDTKHEVGLEEYLEFRKKAFLTIHMIEEFENETEDYLRNETMYVINEVIRVNLSKTDILSVKRINGSQDKFQYLLTGELPRPIRVEFRSHEIKQKVFQRRNGTDLYRYFLEEEPNWHEQALLNILERHLRRARAEHRKATIIGDTLQIEGKMYKIPDLLEIEWAERNLTGRSRKQIKSGTTNVSRQ